MRSLISAIVLLFALTACGGGGDTNDDSSTNAPATSKPSGAANEGESDDEAKVSVLEAGFAQDLGSQYAKAAAVVQSEGGGANGYFIVVSMNFLDKSGATIVTEQQTESISWDDQKLIVPVFTDLGSEDAKVASVEATVTVSNSGATTGTPLTDPVVAKPTRGEFGGTAVKVTYSNPTDEDLTDARAGVLCRNKAGDIIGGESNYPDVVPAGQEIVQSVDITTSEPAASCEATLNYGA